MQFAEYEKMMTSLLKGESATDVFTQTSQFKRYQDSILQMQRDCFATIFPCVKQLVGEECWLQTIDVFIDQHNHKSADISVLGQDFAAFIAHSHLLASAPYLAQMADFEWQWYCCFHDKVGNRRQLQANYPLTQLWQMCQKNYAGDYQLNHEYDNYHFKFYNNGQAVEVEEKPYD